MKRWAIGELLSTSTFTELLGRSIINGVMVSERSPAPGTVGLSRVRFCYLQHLCLSLRPSSGWCVNENSCKCVKNPTGLSVPLHVFCWFPPMDHNATSIRLPPQPQPDCQSCCVEMTGREVNIHLFMLPPSTVQPLSSAVIFPATFYPFLCWWTCWRINWRNWCFLKYFQISWQCDIKQDE